MTRLSDYLFVRHRHNWLLLMRFGVVGGSGVAVNLLTLIIARKLGPHFEDIFVGLPFSDFNIRWYHVFSTIAFMAANLWNFQLNRTWTFKSGKHANWISEYWPFLLVGAVGQAVGLALITLMLHPDSPLALPSSVFDNSTGFRTRLYWAQLIQIAIVTPLSFLLNKLWTFRAVRGKEEAVPGPEKPALADLAAGPDDLPVGRSTPDPAGSASGGHRSSLPAKVPDPGRDVG